MEISKDLCEIFRHMLSKLWANVEVTDEMLLWNIEMNLLAGMVLELDRHNLPEIEDELAAYLEQRDGKAAEDSEEEDIQE